MSLLVESWIPFGHNGSRKLLLCVSSNKCLSEKPWSRDDSEAKYAVAKWSFPEENQMMNNAQYVRWLTEMSFFLFVKNLKLGTTDLPLRITFLTMSDIATEILVISFNDRRDSDYLGENCEVVSLCARKFDEISCRSSQGYLTCSPTVGGLALSTRKSFFRRWEWKERKIQNSIIWARRVLKRRTSNVTSLLFQI